MIQYRPDIDVLRAIAVVPVILYHADLPFMKGGFVGVDVFFVISGFLISSIILREIEAGTFSLMSFYQRRVLRIFPALVLVLCFSLIVGWMVYLPDDYKRVCESVFAASTFISNLYFMKDSGYFGAAPEVKPLLHTWSLAVEEQFYVVFPLYLMLIARFSRKSQVAITIVLWVSGLASSVLVVAHDQPLAFFTLPTRMWELLTGTLLAMGAIPEPTARAHSKAACWVGLGIIAAAVTLYWEGMTFPGLAAIPPVIGSALAIWSGLAASAGQPQFMSNSNLVICGKISYPLYLWHFPLIAFAKYLTVSSVSPWVMSTAVGISVLLSLASWKLFETPIRTRGRNWAPATVVVIGLAAMTLTGGLGLLGYLNRGFEGRISPERLTIVRGVTDRSAAAQECMGRGSDAVRADRLCVLGSPKPRPDTLVWGDSFAEALAPGIATAADRAGKGFYLAGRPGCTPQTGRSTAGIGDAACHEFSAAMHDWLMRNVDVRNVVLVLRWPSAVQRRHSAADPAAGTLAQIGPGRFSSSLTALLHELTAAGKSVWIAGPLPVVGFNLPRALYIQSLGFGAGREIRPLRRDHDAAFAWIDPYVASLAGRIDLRLIRLDPRLCDQSVCKVSENGRPIYFDSSHLSVFGATLVSTEFDQVFRQ